MDVGVEDKTGVKLSGIERCSCPPAYSGYSCEVRVIFSLQSFTCLIEIHFTGS